MPAATVESCDLKPKQIGLATVTTDADTQHRQLDTARVATMAEAAEAAQKGRHEGINHPFPPIKVYSDGKHNWLVDGFHRHAAYQKANLPVILAEVHPGKTLQDALWDACAANQEHDRNGLYRSNKCKQEQVKAALALRPECSDRAIAEHVGVTHPFVAKLRTESPQQSASGGNGYHLNDVQGRDGKTYPVKRKGLADLHAGTHSNGGVTIEAAQEAYGNAVAADPEGVYVKPVEIVMNGDLPPEPLEPGKRDRSNDEDLTDAEWLETLPAWAALKACQHEGHQFRRAALAWRTLQPILADLKRVGGKCLEVDGDDDFTLTVMRLRNVKHPEFWEVCRGCKGTGVNGRATCSCRAGYRLWQG